MSVRKEESGRRSVAVEVEVPGTPEEVWQAIATGPGVSSWFVPTEIRDDGAVISHFGPGMDAVATRTAWEPPRRFAAESEMGPGAPKLATEWVVEARSGGTCVVRVVHSLFAATDDWDNQLESVEGGWPAFFQILRLYLTHFRGEPSSAFQLMAMAAGPASSAWQALAGRLGLDGLAPGDRVESAEGAPPLAGQVVGVGNSDHPGVLLRLDAPAPGAAHLFAMGMGKQTVVSIRLYLYGPSAAEAALAQEPRWQAWLGSLFPAGQGA